MSRNKTEGLYGGSRYGRHWRTREHDLPGCPSYWHAMGAQTRRHRRRFKPGKVAIFAMEYQGVEYPMRQIDENTWEPVCMPYPIPRGEVLRIIPAACKQLASAGGDARPVDCAGDPQCCPQNEGYGCQCSALNTKDKP